MSKSNLPEPEPPEAFTPAEVHFWSVLNEMDELPNYLDEPDVNFVPHRRLKQALWEALQAVRREDAAADVRTCLAARELAEAFMSEAGALRALLREAMDSRAPDYVPGDWHRRAREACAAPTTGRNRQP